MNRLQSLFESKTKNILNIYCTAGFPELDDTVEIIKSLEKAGADLVEIGIPFSDPMADGSTIQASNKVALDGGMTVELLFEKLKDIRKEVSIPLVLMGYLNPPLQYGLDKFLDKCVEVGVDGLILPDLPMYEYETEYKQKFEERNLMNIFLVSPQTSDERILEIDKESKSFIYVVSTYATTGNSLSLAPEQIAYFEKLQQMNLSSPTLIGFGIHDKQTFNDACQYANGAIIGSAFIRALQSGSNPVEESAKFVENILG